MYLGDHARLTPTKAALISAATGRVTTYRELDQKSNRLANALYAAGLRPGDNVGLLMENHPRFMEVLWAGMRSGLYVTPINRFLTEDEAAYICNDAGIKALISSATLAPTAAGLLDRVPTCKTFLMAGGASPGWQPYETVVAAQPVTPLAEEPLGHVMFYSSGTTGQPKGIDKPLSGLPASSGKYRTTEFMREFGFDADTVYLSTAPLYHAAPGPTALAAQFVGGTVVMMEKFDPQEALRLIERYQVTHSQWVPTMFVRLLKLPEPIRGSYIMTSMRCAIHAGAPCPLETKQAMIEWWGPILHEYYGGSEQFGRTQLDSQEWLAHPGSVGRPRHCVLHICDPEGNELPQGSTGTIYFESANLAFAYRNDPVKTAGALHPLHPTWGTYGDIGYVDADGYLYLTDRLAFTIVSGGVNIYPQAIENALVQHPAVGDAAVFGVPSPEMGEDVKAVVELMPGVEPTPELAAEILAFTGTRVARYMIPRSLDFIDKLPRLPTGKLYKQELRAQYWRPRCRGPRRRPDAMTVTLASLTRLAVREYPVAWDERDTLLYALSLGMGDDAGDALAQHYISELGGLRTVPTQATVLARTPMLKDCGIDFTRMLHGEQRLEIHSPLPPQGRLLLDARIAGVVDMGAGKGSRIRSETTGRLEGEGAPLFTSHVVLFCRGDGGIGSMGEDLAPLPRVPQRAPDRTANLPTRNDQAYLYRLNGDRNPIHIDAGVARQAGLERPLLHGLCTFGMCARALLGELGEEAPRMASLGARFAAPFYPGETLAVDLWREGDAVFFQARALERGVIAISHGVCMLRPPS